MCSSSIASKRTRLKRESYDCSIGFKKIFADEDSY